MAKKLITIER